MIHHVFVEEPNGDPLEAVALSRGQRAMWFLWNLNPEGAEYGLPMAWTIRAKLDVGAFRGALQDLVDRHPIMRTTYAVRQGEPVQLVHAKGLAHFQQVDASGWTEERLGVSLLEEAHAPFDLEKGPIFRAHLFSRRDDEHVLLLNSHHIASDTWTLIVLMEELGMLYRARVEGATATLPPVGLSYNDFVAWQNRMLDDRRGEAHWRYWQTQLAEPPTLDLPTDRPRPQVATHAGAGYPFEVSRELTMELRLLARQEGVTLYTVLLAAFYVLLYRYSGQEDLVVGSPRFGRPPEGFERTVGYFASPCALRTGVRGEASFAEFLSQVRQVLVGAKDHQDFPFPLVVERLGVARDLSRSPVFQVAFTYQKSHLAHMQGVAAARMGIGGAKLDLSDLLLESYPLVQHSVKFDLDFVVEEVDGSLRAVCWYNTDLWERETVGALVAHYRALLASAARDPHVAVDRLPMLTPREQEALAAWNRTDTPMEGASVLHLFAAQVVRTPHAPALRFDGREIAYGELNRRANRLANYLRRSGLEKGQLVGVRMERSPELIVSILGILKAGCAYVPLDPAYPQDRLAFVREDAGVNVLLTQSSLQAQSSVEGIRTILLDREGSMLEKESVANPESGVTPEDLAYVIYTSGSTGRPKGVLLEHRGLSNLVQAQIEAFAIQPGSRVLQFASFSFDASVSEIFTALCAGATLCVASKSELMPGSALVRTLNDNAVTVVTLPPSVLGLLKPDDVPTVKTVVTAGEACSMELVKRWAPGRRFLNAYGPTEATVCTTIAHLDAQTERVTIGRPIANMRVHVLDKCLQPVPIGVVGEIHIAGTGLARGYLGRPDVTAERFLPNPFGTPGERMYKSGDLARWLPDGRLEFLGRLDDQVKMRGFRIELGEIETVLAEHPHIREALVVARKETNGDQRLVAYLIPQEAKAVSAAEVRTYVQSKVPDFMVPAAFVVLEKWPLTPNGKIDRRALPAPTNRSEQAGTILPQDPLERQIAAIWQDVLGLQAVGVDDNFFEVGGHSLSLVQVEVRLSEELGRSIPTMDLFRYPTIRSLAHHLSASRRGEEGEGEVAPLRTVETNKPLTSDIAIVGMAGRFPGASNVEAFWRNLVAGVESVRDLTDDELLAAGVDEALLHDPRYVKRKGTLDGVEFFDAPFFGFPPREAQRMDPQQRLFLEVGWQALEHAGYSSQTYPGRIGVYGGMGRPGYLLHHIRNHPESAAELFMTTILNEKDFLSTRLAYKLNLRGPALTVQTACSTSLVAVHLACQQLSQNDCDMALAGGVSIEIPQGSGYSYQEGHILSPDGRCRAFDAEARGTVRGSGGAVVVLKRLDDALRDGNTVWAVIKGSALNNDGSMKVGYTAPSVEGQAEVIEQALRRAGVDPRTIGFVEAHGTGTPLGDPIEVAALTQAYRSYTKERGYCYLGSVKTNVGHLDAAAGVTGLIKATLALHHGVIPPTLHFQTPNPKLGLEASPFVVNAEGVEWKRSDVPRRAAVSSFGIGGTNAHMILEEAPQETTAVSERPYQVLTLSAKSELALNAMTNNLARHLREHPDANLADVAYTLQVGRTPFPHRRVVVCTDPSEAAEVLTTPSAQRSSSGTPADHSRVIFLFPGQGLQKVNMGRDLYESEPLFRKNVDTCAEVLQPLLGMDLREVLYPEPHDVEQAARQLAQTAITQPALFVVEYALARLLMTWGVQPQAMMGHSLGEYVAACLAGVMSLSDALRLVAERGKLVQRLPGGAMLAVACSSEAVQPFVGAGVDLAVVNGPESCVLAGTPGRMEALQEALTAAGLRWQAVRTSHAFHSAMLDPILEEFWAKVREVELQAPKIPYVTNVTGNWVTPEEATDPAHWVRHLRQTVRFAEGLDVLLTEPGGLFLEVGPGQTFHSVLRRHPRKQNALVARPTLATAAETSDGAALMMTLGQLWVAGVTPEWQNVHADQKRRRVPLPVYPFDRHRYWLEARPVTLHGEWMAEVAVASEAVVEPAPVSDRPDAPVVGPRNEVEWELVKIFEDVLGMAPVGVTDNFFELGGSSLSALSVMIRLEQSFGCRLSNAVLLENQTVETLAQVLRAEQPPQNARLVGMRATGALPPIFCIHPYGGHTMGYTELVRYLGADQPVYGVQAQGMQGEAVPFRRIEDMATDYIRLIKTKQQTGPYRLVGHSMGGCIAYEMAQQLRQAGEDVELLALLDSRAQNFSEQPLYRNGTYGELAGKGWLSDEAVMLGILLPKLSMDWERLRDVSHEQQWLEVREAAMQQGLLPLGTGAEQLRHLLSVTRANDEALRTYRPKRYEGDVLLFNGDAGFAKKFGEPDLGWGERVAGRFEVIQVPGDHHSIMVGIGAQAMARHLQERLRVESADRSR